MSISDKSPTPKLPPDAEALLNESPPSQIEEFLHEPYRLSDQQVETYARDGFIKLEQVLTGEPLRYYRELIGMAVGHRFKDDDRGLAEKPVYERSFLQAHSLGLRYPALRSFVQSIRFATIARDLMRVEGIRLYFDQALYKEPGGRITDFHQDGGYWPIEPATKTTTIWLALVDAPRERGCMAFAKGSHRQSPEPEFVDIFNAKAEIPLTERAAGFEWEWAPVAAGDCTFHSGLTYHRAAANETDQMREAMTIAYMVHYAIYDWPYWNDRIKDFGKWANEGLKRGDHFTLDTTPRLV